MDREIDDLEGFWVNEDPSRALHIGWEDEDTLYFDLFDSKSAAWTPEGNDSLTSILLNVRTGEVQVGR